MENGNKKSTSLEGLRRAGIAPEGDLPQVRVGFGDLQSFALAQRVGTALSSSTLIPKDYQGNLPNCLIALEMAGRLNASVLMVMQNLYIVHGRPGWSAQFLTACFNQCGRFTAIRYRWQGTQGKDDWGCRAWAHEKGTDNEIIGPLVTIGLAKSEGWYGRSGSKWQTIPELMLMYRAASWLTRTHAPELSMGLPTAEELQDLDSSKMVETAYATTTDEIEDSIPEETTNADPEDAEPQEPTQEAPESPQDATEDQDASEPAQEDDEATGEATDNAEPESDAFASLEGKPEGQSTDPLDPGDIISRQHATSLAMRAKAAKMTAKDVTTYLKAIGCAAWTDLTEEQATAADEWLRAREGKGNG